MNERAVTELVIDARGAEAGTAQYVRAMAAAQSAVDKVIDREEKLNTAVAQSTMVMTGGAQSVGRIAAAYDRLRSSIDPVAKVQIASQRELERAMLTADSAVKRGLTTEVEAAATLARLRERQVVDLNEVRAATDRLTAAQKGQHATSFNTSNVAAQFQDIGVTSAMGMNPLQIALQQGTQLSAVLGGQGLTGVVRTLGAAFASIISPVSLITIAVVALVAGGIQWMMSLGHEADKTAEKLAAHSKWLDTILAGYKSAADAAKKAAEEALKLPQGSVESNLDADRVRATKDLAAALEALKAVKTDSAAAEIGYLEAVAGTTDASLKQLDALNALRDGFDAANPNLDAMHEALTKIINSDPSETIRLIAQQMLGLVDQARAADAAVAGTAAGLKDLKAIGPINISIGISSNNALEGIAAIRALAPDLRTAYQKVDDELKGVKDHATGLPTALAEPMVMAAEAAAKATKATLDQQAAQIEATKAAASGAKATDTLADAYKNLLDRSAEFVAQQQLEATLIGKSAEEADRARYAFDMLNDARRAGIAITDQVRERIELEAAAQAKAKAQTDALVKAENDHQRALGLVADGMANLVSQSLDFIGISGPLGGAIEGALGSLMKGDLIGALIGGIFGAINGAIEDAKKRQQAITALDNARPDIGDFLAKSQGHELSDLAAAMRRVNDQAAQFIKLAQAAGDTALVARIRAATAAYKQQLQLEDARSKIREDQDKLSEAYERQASSLSAVIDRTKDFIQQLGAFRAGLKLDEALSPLGPKGRMNEAQRQFDAIARAARLGNVDAQGQLQGAATSYLDSARGYYGSSDQYQAIFKQVDAMLGTVLGSAQTRLTGSEAQLAATNKQIALLADSSKTLQTIAQLIAQLRKDNAALAKIVAAGATGTINAINGNAAAAAKKASVTAMRK